MTKQEKARKVYEEYQKIKDDTQDWREKRDRNKKVYLGDQWDSKVADRVRGRGQVDVVMNILRTLIRNRVSTMIARKPTGKVYAVNKESMDIATVLDDFLDWHWYNSSGQIRAERVTMSAQREGVGYFVVYADHKADYGRGELKVTDEIWRHVWIPKTAGREWDFSDSPRIILTKLLHEDEFYANNPGYKGKLTPDYFHTNDEIYWAGQKEHKDSVEIDMPEGMITEGEFIREFDNYERFYKEVPVIYHIPTGTVEVVDDNYTPNENEQVLIEQKVIQFTRATVPRIRYQKSYGDKIFTHEEILPISNYPVIPVVDEDTGNALPQGEIDMNFGVQELANKAWSIIVHNAALSSNFKMLIDSARAGVKDLKKFKEDWAAPGALLDVKMDPQTGKFPIEPFKSEPINQAFYTIFERLFAHLQFGTATFSSKLGDTSNAPDTYSATLQYGEWQQDNLRIPLSRLEMGLQRVFETILEWSPSYYTFHKVFHLLTEHGEMREQSVNAPNFVEGAWKTMNDISKVRAKFRIRMGSTMPANSVAHMKLYQELAAINPIFLKKLVEYLPLKDKAETIKEIDALQQAQQKLQEQEQTLNTTSGMLQNSLRQQAQMEINKDVQDSKRKQAYQEDKQKIDGERQKLQNEREAFRREKSQAKKPAQKGKKDEKAR